MERNKRTRSCAFKSLVNHRIATICGCSATLWPALCRWQPQLLTVQGIIPSLTRRTSKCMCWERRYACFWAHCWAQTVCSTAKLSNSSARKRSALLRAVGSAQGRNSSPSPPLTRPFNRYRLAALHQPARAAALQARLSLLLVQYLCMWHSGGTARARPDEPTGSHLASAERSFSSFANIHIWAWHGIYHQAREVARVLRPHYNVTVRFQARFLFFKSSAHRLLCMLSRYQVAKVQRCWLWARFLS